MQYKKVRIFGRYEHGDEQNNDQLIKLYLDEAKCYGEQIQNESVREKEGIFVIDEKGDVFELKSFENMKDKMPDDLFTEHDFELKLKPITGYEIYASDDDGRHIETLRLNTSKEAHEIDFSKLKKSNVSEKATVDCYISEKNELFSVKSLGLDSSTCRDLDADMFDVLKSKLLPHEIAYLEQLRLKK
jgi:hypothetical protein